MVRICDTQTHGEHMEVYVILTEILNWIDPLKNVIVDMRIILEWILEKQGVKEWPGLNCSRSGRVLSICYHSIWFYKLRNISDSLILAIQA
jgi:hypothetical protein